MKMMMRCVLVAVVFVSGTGVSIAGDLFGLHGGCNCNRPAPVVAVAPVVHQPVFHMAPVVGDACGCSAAVPACCGLGGLAGIGSFYSSNVAYGGHFAMGHGGGYGSPAPGSFVSGFAPPRTWTAAASIIAILTTAIADHGPSRARHQRM